MTTDAEAREALLTEIRSLNMRIQTLTSDIMGPAPLPPDLTMRQMHVLISVARHPGLTSHELSDQLQVSPPTASGLIDRLADKGLVERTADPADRRVRRLNLSDEGRALLDSLQSRVDEFIAWALPLVSVDDLIALRHSSQIMLTVLEKARNEAGRHENAGSAD